MRSLVPNLRDVGGMSTDIGAVVRHGLLLRSAMPAVGDGVPDGVAWPPSVVIDLRSAPELETTHPLQGNGTRIVNLPLLSALRPGAAPVESLHGLYLLMLDTAAPHLVDLVHEVTVADGATLVHCAAGKDRTGLSIALLLRLVGVSREQVLADYLATELAAESIRARLGMLPGRANHAKLPPAFLAVSGAAIDAVLDVWDGHEGGVHGWFVTAGGDVALVEQLRRILTA